MNHLFHPGAFLDICLSPIRITLEGIYESLRDTQVGLFQQILISELSYSFSTNGATDDVWPVEDFTKLPLSCFDEIFPRSKVAGRIFLPLRLTFLNVSLTMFGLDFPCLSLGPTSVPPLGRPCLFSPTYRLNISPQSTAFNLLLT